MMGVQPYISFKGKCAEAIEFYKQALDAELVYSHTYGDSPMADMGPADAIMHCTLKIGDTHLMMSDDMRPEAAEPGGNISLSIGTNDVEAAKRYFAALSDGGKVVMPLEKTFWADAFGTATDKFGIAWMVNCESGHGDKPHGE